MIARADAVVIGGGIIGASVAYFLARREFGDVVLVERAEICSGATRHSAAHIRQHYSNEIAIRLALRALHLFQNDYTDLGGPTGFTQTGYLLLASADDTEGVRRNVELQRKLGVDTNILTPAEVAARWPEIDITGVALAVHEPLSGYADPVQTVNTLIRATRSLGGVVYDHTPVIGINARDGAVRSVITPRGEIKTRVVVNASGPWANRIAKMVGGSYSLRLSREEEAIFELPLATEHLPIVSDAPGRLYFRPAGTNKLLAGFGYPKEFQPCDPDDFNDRADDAAVAWLASALRRRLYTTSESLAEDTPEWTTVGRYAGIYSVTDDWYPIVGSAECLKGMYEAVGGSGHSFKLGPPIGEALADLISGQTAAIDVAPLHGSRFKHKTTFQSIWGAGNRG
jgi:glycine/D-amino acid oxidase-like deaminating enzyme